MRNYTLETVDHPQINSIKPDVQIKASDEYNTLVKITLPTTGQSVYVAIPPDSRGNNSVRVGITE